MLPAVGQGALGLECRASDSATQALVARLNHPPTHQAVLAERAFLKTLQGGCQVPIGAAASVVGDSLAIRGAVLSPDGKRRIDSSVDGLAMNAEQLGSKLAMELLQRGAAKLLTPD
jgi:hydroxymethylbilane synthase